MLVYLTGHGGDGFIKFRDTDILNGKDLTDTIKQMKSKGKTETKKRASINKSKKRALQGNAHNCRHLSSEYIV